MEAHPKLRPVDTAIGRRLPRRLLPGSRRTSRTRWRRPRARPRRRSIPMARGTVTDRGLCRGRRRGPLLRLPHLRERLPYGALAYDEKDEGLEGQRGALQGLRDVRGRVSVRHDVDEPLHLGTDAGAGARPHRRKQWLMLRRRSASVGAEEVVGGQGRDRPPNRRDALFTSISGEEVDLMYTPEDVAELDYERDLGYPGEFPYTRGVQAQHVPGPAVDDAAVLGIRHGGGHQPPQQVPARARPDGPVRRVRLPDHHGLRLGPRARGGRGRHLRRRHRLSQGHGDAVRRHPAGQGKHRR